MFFLTVEHKQTQIVTIQALSSINTTLDFKVEIAGAGSLNIRTCINYWELVTTCFELNVLLNFLDIWTKIMEKEPSNFGLKEKITIITQVG